MGTPNGGVECKGVLKNCDFRQISHFSSDIIQENCDFRQISRFSSDRIQDRAMVTIEGEQETISKLLNGTSCNDLQ